MGQTLLGRLRVLRRLGSGGMGTVYEVEHLITHHRRALKVLDPAIAKSGEAVSRLVREAGVAGKTGCDAIVETFDVGRLDDGSPYVLMELLEGATVGEALERRGRLPTAVAVRIARRICEALAVAHDHGIVHRDVKPDNVFLLGGEPEEARVKILDFGIATVLPGHQDQFTNLTRTGTTPGTPLYMAPEQMSENAPIDGRADLYAVSLVLYEMLAGRRPFTATTLVGLITQVHKGEFVPLTNAVPGIDPRLAEIVHRGMRPSPSDRFADARAMAAELAPFESAPAPSHATAAFAPTELALPAHAAPRTGSEPAVPQRTAPQPLAPAPVRPSRSAFWPVAIALLSLGALAVAGAVAAAWVLGDDYDDSTVEHTTIAGPEPAITGTEDDIAVLARSGRARDCLDRALEAPPTARIVRLRLSCARAAGDWDAYREACELQETRYPEDDPAGGCRNTITLHESGAVR